MRRGARAAARAGRRRRRLAGPAATHRRPRTAGRHDGPLGISGRGGSVEEPFAPSTGRAAPDEARRRRPLPRRPEGRALARPLPAEPADRRDVRRGDAALDGEGLVGARRRDRARQGRGRRRPRLGGLDGPAGRVGHGAGPGRLVRRQDPQRLVDVDPAQRRLLRRARRPAPAPLVAHGSTCSRCSRSGSRCCSSTAARSS